MSKLIFGRTAAKAVTVISTAAASIGAQASILPADFQTQMDTVGTDITTVGGALIALAVIAVGVKWVKATFFG